MRECDNTVYCRGYYCSTQLSLKTSITIELYYVMGTLSAVGKDMETCITVTTVWAVD